jgi:hypothetical protein
LEEEACWQNAKSKTGLSGYFYYLTQYPGGKYAEEAKKMIEKLGDPQDHKALKKGLEIQKRSLSPEPGVTVNEEKAWRDAKKQDTFVAYQNFSQSFADSKYVPEAKLKMNALDKMASDKIRIESASTIGVEKSRLSSKEKIHSLEKLIKNCKRYFQDYPAGNSNLQVKKIKDNSQLRLLNLLR